MCTNDPALKRMLHRFMANALIIRNNKTILIDNTVVIIRRMRQFIRVALTEILRIV